MGDLRGHDNGGLPLVPGNQKREHLKNASQASVLHPPVLMTDQPQRAREDWKTGDEPMTDAEASYRRTLSEEAGEPFDETLTKAQGSERIDAVRHRSPGLNEENDNSTPPHPSPAEGGGESAPRPPRPSQAEGER